MHGTGTPLGDPIEMGKAMADAATFTIAAVLLAIMQAWSGLADKVRKGQLARRGGTSGSRK